MKIIQCEQYDDRYWEVRRGIPTASEFSSIITPKTAKLSAAADTYICRLIGDLFDIEYPRKNDMATAAMRRGTEMEPESRRFYELEKNHEVQQVGFCLTDDGRFGCSPDALVNDDGVLELKNPMPSTQVEYLLAGVMPDEHKVQVHGHLIVTGRKWCDLMCYCPGFPPLLVRQERDDFTHKLAVCLEQFYEKMTDALKKLGLERPALAA